MRETLRPGRGATAFAVILSTLALAAMLILAGCGTTSTGPTLGAESPTATTAPTTAATTPTPSGPSTGIHHRRRHRLQRNELRLLPQATLCEGWHDRRLEQRQRHDPQHH